MSGVPSSESPSRTARWAATSSPSPSGKSEAIDSVSFARAVAAGSVSKTPASWRTCCPKAPNPVVSPYGRQRPLRKSPSASSVGCSSRTSRLFPDPGSSDHRDDLRPVVGAHLVPERREQLELLARPINGARGARSCSSGRRRPSRIGIGSAFLHRDRIHRLVLEGPARGEERPRADDHAPGRRQRLEPGDGVHHVAGRDALAPLRRVAERDDRLARVHRDADGEPQLRVLLVQRFEGADDRDGRLDGARRVVLVGQRRAEDADDRVADELLDGAAERLDLVADARVVRPEPRPDVLWVGAVRVGGRADEVREEHRDDLALLTVGLGRGRLGGDQRGAARAAEAGVGRADGAARQARDAERRTARGRTAGRRR